MEEERQALFSGIEPRQYVLHALLLTTIPIATVLLVLNIHLNATSLAAANLALIVVSLFSLLFMRWLTSHQLAALAYLSTGVANVVVTLSQPNLHPGTATSLTLIPVFAYLLLEVKWAFPFTLISIGVAAVAYVAGAGTAPYRMDPRYTGHILMPILVLFFICHLYARRRSVSSERFVEQSLRDPMTGLWNREKLATAFAREKQRAEEDGTPLSLILVDLDHFKKINDRYGHEAGDGALVFFARLLATQLRTIDLACRFGGEEFAVLLPGTDRSRAFMIADDLRNALESTAYDHGGQSIQLTLSAGVAELGGDGSGWLPVYRAADKRLYAAKAMGRNCIMQNDANVRTWSKRFHEKAQVGHHNP